MVGQTSCVLVDVGNSQIKWLEVSQADTSVWGMQQYCARSGEALVASLKSAGLSPQPVFVSSVAGELFNAELTAAMRAAGWESPHFAVSQGALLGVTNSYSEPSRMGVDRWLAMLASWSRAAPACVVVDAGTALTIDMLDNCGVHTGGYILPGVDLMESVLTRETQRVRFSDSAERTLRPGQSTAQCVSSGIWLATYAAVQTVLSANPNHRVLVTGGGARALLDLGVDGEWRPLLVLEGLYIHAQTLTKG